jgi:hypothetical protein
MNIRAFFNSVVPALVLAGLVVVPVQAQDDAEQDTVDHEMIKFSYPGEDGKLTVDEKI